MAELVTGEAVALDLTIARFPSRIVALLIDLLVEIPALLLAEFIVLTATGRYLDSASAAAVAIAVYAGTVIAYPVAFETLSRGKTLGKMALGIRVVSDDGGPVRFRQALIRGLAIAFVEFWSPLSVIGMPAGLILSMASPKGKRLGDLFAGTFVIQERVPRPASLPAGFFAVPPGLEQWAYHAELSRLSDHTVAAVSGYLRRYYSLLPQAREALGIQLATAVAAQVSPEPPPGTHPAAYLAAVLAVRRQREVDRMQARQAAQATHAAGLAGAAAVIAPTAPPPATPASGADGAGSAGRSTDAPPEDFGFAVPF